MDKQFEYVCFADTLSFAETLGWSEPDELNDLQGYDWTPVAADALEESALEFIREAGFKIIYGETDED